MREYIPGDDVRDIDWNVTARCGRPFVKRYVEERAVEDHLCGGCLAVSLSFGTAGRCKSELAAEFCALVAFSAIRNNDAAGLLLFTDQVELFVPPAKRSSHVLRLIHEVMAFEPRRKGTDIAAPLEYLGRVMHRRCVVFLVSDFFGGEFEVPLRILAKRHDLIAVRTADPCERALPDAGLMELLDPESGRRVLVDSSASDVRESYALLSSLREERISRIFRTAGVDQISVSTDKECVGALVSFFRTRENRR